MNRRAPAMTHCTDVHDPHSTDPSLSDLKHQLKDFLTENAFSSLTHPQIHEMIHYFTSLLHENSEKNGHESDEESTDEHDHGKDTTHEQIIEYLKTKCPAPYEPESQKQRRFPTSSVSFESYTPENTIEVDSYLYNDDQIDQLVDEGLMSRSYCQDCGSRNVKYLNMISHSMGEGDLQELIKAMNEYLACDKIKSVLIDVGSRLGGVLWEAYFNLKNVHTLVGIEIDDKYVKLQRDIIDRFGFNRNGSKKIEIVHDDVLNQSALFKRFSERYIVLFHNVFEWFVDDDEAHQNAWRSMKKLINKKGSIIISSPPLKQSLKDANMKNGNAFVDDWVEEIFVMRLDMMNDGQDEDDESGLVAFYKVK